jgi:hypothetical protein
VAPLCPSSYGKWVTKSGKVLGLTDEAGTTFSRSGAKRTKPRSEFPEFADEGAYRRNAIRLATQTKSTEDIIVDFRPSDGTKVVYERSTNTITFAHGKDVGSSFRPKYGEEYFRRQLR